VLARRVLLGAACLSVAGLILWSGLPATTGASDQEQGASAFPGRNGLIVFEHHATVAAERNGEWGRLYTIIERGRSLRLIARNAAGAAWSPDGRRLAASLGDGSTVLPGAPKIIDPGVFDIAWAPDGYRQCRGDAHPHRNRLLHSDRR
jgi:hypothetical protein